MGALAGGMGGNMVRQTATVDRRRIPDSYLVYNDRTLYRVVGSEGSMLVVENVNLTTATASVLLRLTAAELDGTDWLRGPECPDLPPE